MKKAILSAALQNKKRPVEVTAKNSFVTRAAAAVNPLTAYNVSTGNVLEQFAANAPVKHGDYLYVNGDTLEIIYDMGTKIANDIVACPCKAYWQFVNLAALPNPTTGWTENTGQSYLDVLKTVDNNSWVGNCNINGQGLALMLEVDLNPLCVQKYSGSRAAMIADIKNIQADIWAKAEGSNAGVLTNGVTTKLFNSTGSIWSSSIVGSNSTAAIAKMTIIRPNDGFQGEFISATNKLYIIVYANYPSNGTINSSVSLDYAKITLQLNQAPTVGQPKTVYVPKYWAAVGTISPNWDSTYATKNGRVFELFIDATNLFRFYWNAASKVFTFEKIIGGVAYAVASAVPTFSKNTVYKYIVGQHAGGMFLLLLKNGGNTEKVTNTNTNSLSGPMQLMPQRSYGGTQQGDVFADVFALHDLQAIGKPNSFTDAEYEVILRGIQYPSPSEMVVNGGFDSDTAWTKHANAVISGGVLTLNATAAWQLSRQYVEVLSNSQYKLKADITGINGKITPVFVDATNTVISSGTAITPAANEAIITTPNNCAKIDLRVENSTAGTFTFDNISVKYVKPAGQLITAVNKELFDINAVSLHAYATRANGTVTFNATAGNQACTLDFPVLPNTRYNLKGFISNTALGAITTAEYYNNVVIRYNACNLDGAGLEKSFITGPNTNKVRVSLYAVSAGTVVYKDISFKPKQ